MSVSPPASRYCAVRLTSGSGCCENEPDKRRTKKAKQARLCQIMHDRGKCGLYMKHILNIDEEKKMTSMQSKPSIVFCHGLWADGSCFSKLIVPLQAEGYECIASQYGFNTTAEDVALVKATMGRVSSPVILVGHSYGGSVITGGGTDNRVVGLVYICALAPDADETSETQQSKFPRTDVFSHIEVVDGRIWLRPEGTKYFCGDLSEQEQKLVWATQGVPKPDLFEAKVGGTAWKSKPSWYIVGKKDHTVHPDLERFFAKRMGATTYELESSHVPMLSQPNRVLDAIRAAANAAQADVRKAAPASGR